jgi:hypothetical protein
MALENICSSENLAILERHMDALAEDYNNGHSVKAKADAYDALGRIAKLGRRAGDILSGAVSIANVDPAEVARGTEAAQSAHAAMIQSRIESGRIA